VTLNVQEAGPSETLVPYITTRRHNPGDRNMNLFRRESPKLRTLEGDWVYI